MDEQEFGYIRREIQSLVGDDVTSYKPSQVQRRLSVFLVRSGHAEWPAFFRAARADPPSLRKLRDYLTVNVSAFFRDPEKYAHLGETLLPQLWRNRSALRVWSVGCAEGQEAYSLAILLAESDRSSRQSHYILGTDFDESAIEHGKAGGPYSSQEVTHVTKEQVSHYFQPVLRGYHIVDELRTRVRFRKHNLLHDPFEGPFDLIACRNVIIYFAPEIRETLYRRFREALIPGGVFFVGGTETVANADALGFETVGVSFYRRRPDKKPPVDC